MKRKIVPIAIIFALVLSISTLKVNAATDACKITLNPKSSSVAQGDTIDIEIKMSNITSSDGIAVYEATITYDTKAFEYSKIAGYGEWETPTYNEGNIVSLTTSGSGQTTDQIVAVLTLKVKSDVADGEYNVKISDIKCSDAVNTLSASSATTKVKVAKTTSSSDDTTKDSSSDSSNSKDTTDDKSSDSSNSKDTTDDKSSDSSNSKNTTDDKSSDSSNSKDTTDDKSSNSSNSKNSSTSSNSSKNASITATNSSTSTKSLPYAGIGLIIIPVITIAAIVGGVSYYNYKKFKNI